MTDLPLYPSEQQVARAVLGPHRYDEWKGLAPILEREGFPQIEPRFGGRYWPACEHWFQVKHRLVKVEAGRLGREDGEETWDRNRKRPASAGTPLATVHKLHTGSPGETT